jgi:hypothetical protein
VSERFIIFVLLLSLSFGNKFIQDQLFTKMPEKSVPFHEAITSSRVTSSGKPPKASCRLSSRINNMAAAKLSFASSTALTWPLAPGISSQYANIPINLSNFNFRAPSCPCG